MQQLLRLTKNMETKMIKKLSLFLALLLLTAGSGPAVGEVTEYGVKAAYLYNFTQFVQWPDGTFDSSDSPLVIGILGDDPFGGVLDDAVKGKTAGGHPLTVKRLGPYKAGKGAALAKCQILFIAYSEKDQLREILKSLSGAPTLSVSEIENFPLKGGLVQFDQEGQKITLVLNNDGAVKAGFVISSQLLQIAKLYKAQE
jgi:hypothetical protein